MSGKKINITKNAENPNQVDTENEILPGYASMEEFIKEGFKTLGEAIRNSNGLPNGRDWNFYNTHETFKQIINDEGNHVQKMINTVLRKNEIEGNIRNRIVDEATELIVEANDIILEKVASNIDEMNGIKKTSYEPILIQAVSAQLPLNGSWNRVNNATFSVSSSITTNQPSNAKSIRLLTAKNIIRPQKCFKDKICNSSSYPWEPKITDKPNSLKPLAIFLEHTERGEEYSHPYEFELERFVPSSEQLTSEEPQVPKPISETPLVEVNNAEQLNELLQDLRACNVFAVDLEHHSYRSFMGITCLMQISTAEKDYIIDTLALRDKLHVLNEVFTKPTILKIFHGADMDIQWLQRDLGLYVVNMFDTHQASKLLDYSGLSLSYLLNRFCNFVPNKMFQLADWRIRPLPEELKSYAREDTHYLIYIYQKLKEALLEKANGQDNLLRSAFQRSTEICLKRYFKPVLREDSYMDFYRKCKRMFDNRQLYALKELYKWRDTLSREEDESTGYVLPNHMLLQISESLPREMQGILACCNPIPPLVKANLLDLHHIILKARDQPLNKPILQEDTRARGQTKKISKINVDSPLHCPHDLTKSNEFRDDLSTLLDKHLSFNAVLGVLNEDVKLEKSQATCSAFDTPENSDREDSAEVKVKLESIKFLGPYERYKLVKPFIQAEEERLNAESSRQDASATQVEETTDEQRIESIREHFLNLSKKSAANQSLLEMGGSKKRKRDESEDPRYHSSYNIPENSLHTPVPTISFNRFDDSNRKRKSSDPLESPNKQFRHDAPNKRNRFKKPNKNKQNNAQQNNAPKNSPNNQQKNKFNKNQKKPNNQNANSNPPLNKNKGKQKFQNQRFNNQQQQQRGQGPSNNDFTGDNFADYNNFSSYDYSSVDYRQFQGGAGRVERPREFKSNFKSKGKKRGANKGFNKSQTFGNSSRGRGR